MVSIDSSRQDELDATLSDLFRPWVWEIKNKNENDRSRNLRAPFLNIFYLFNNSRTRGRRRSDKVAFNSSRREESIATMYDLVRPLVWALDPVSHIAVRDQQYDLVSHFFRVLYRVALARNPPPFCRYDLPRIV